MQRPTGDPKKPTWPWDVFRAGDGIAPANDVRYEHTTRLVLFLFVVTVFVGVLAGPARSVETEMMVEVRDAKAAGFPQLPPGHASSARIAEFVDEWNLNAPGSPSRREIDAMSGIVGDYQLDTSLYNLGLSFSVIAVLFTSAVVGGRMLSNLRALGHEAALLAAAWAFAVWFIPIMNLVVPWKIVARCWRYAWPPSDAGSGGIRIIDFVGVLWGVVWIGFLVVNPFGLSLFVRTGDVDGWVRRVAATELMMVWLPLAMLFNVGVLAAISYRQRMRYRLLDALARQGV